MSQNWNLLRNRAGGGGAQTKNPFLGGVWMFSRGTKKNIIQEFLKIRLHLCKAELLKSTTS